MRETLTTLVRGLGYDPVAVADGEAALAAVAAAPPDLLLSDIAMPGLTGLEVCRRLKADPATRLIPVILITGLGDEYKIDGIEAGADDFLGKPFSPAELRARIRALLRMKAFTDELNTPRRSCVHWLGASRPRTPTPRGIASAWPPARWPLDGSCAWTRRT